VERLAGVGGRHADGPAGVAPGRRLSASDGAEGGDGGRVGLIASGLGCLPAECRSAARRWSATMWRLWVRGIAASDAACTMRWPAAWGSADHCCCNITAAARRCCRYSAAGPHTCLAALQCLAETCSLQLC